MVPPLATLLVVVSLGAAACGDGGPADGDAGGDPPVDGATRCGIQGGGIEGGGIEDGAACAPDAGPSSDSGRDARSGAGGCTACAEGGCLPGALGGGCASPCGGSGHCAAEAVCAPIGRDPEGQLVGVCLGPRPAGRALAGACDADADCASYACVDAQCTEACAGAGECFPGQACLPIARPELAVGEVRACTYEPRDADVQVDTVPLGGQIVRSDGAPARIDLAVPPDAVSVTLVAHQPAGTPVPLAFTNLWDARDEPLYDLMELAEFIDQPERWIPIDTEEAIAMLVPNSTPDRLRFEPGHLAARIAALESEAGATGDARIELSVLIKRASSDLRGGVLDLRVFLVGIGLSADDARTDSRLAGVLDQVEAIFGGAGISLGSVTFVEITGEAADRLGVVDSSKGPESELAELLRHSRDRSGLVLNLFLVRQIAEGAGEGTISLGISGGLPGPPGLHGTMHSGVAVSFDPAVVGDEPEIPAQIVAHEIGHFLGLFHTTESARPCRDGQGPTPTDPCAPFGGGDVLADTEHGDGNNLMYFAVGGDDGQTYNVDLSEGQAYVLSRSPLLR